MNVLEPLLPAEDELQVSARGVGLFQLQALKSLCTVGLHRSAV